MTKVRLQNDFRKVRQATKQGQFRGMKHAAAAIRLRARSLLRVRAKGKKKGEYSSEGSPPNSPTKRLKGAVVYDVNPSGTYAAIGTAKEYAGPVGQAFEHEGKITFRGRRYGPRRFMRPALQQLQFRLPASWEGKIT